MPVAYSQGYPKKAYRKSKGGHRRKVGYRLHKGGKVYTSKRQLGLALATKGFTRPAPKRTRRRKTRRSRRRRR